MKKLFLFSMSLILNFQLFSQEVPMELIDRANAVEFIFEGEVIESNSYYSNNGRYIIEPQTLSW